MKQKIIKVGKNAAVTIPDEFLVSARAAIGSSVSMQLEPAMGRIIIDIVHDRNWNGHVVRDADMIDPEVYRVAKDLLKRYKVAFDELAKR